MGNPIGNPVAGYGLTVQFTLTDGTGAAVNLTGATGSVHLLSPVGTSASTTFTVSSGSGGVLEAAFSSADVPVGGIYAAYASVTLSDGTQAATSPLQSFAVDPAPDF